MVSTAHDNLSGHTRPNLRERTTSISVPVNPPPPYTRFADATYSEAGSASDTAQQPCSSIVAAVMDSVRGVVGAFATEDLEAGYPPLARENPVDREGVQAWYPVVIPSNTVQMRTTLSALETISAAGNELGSYMQIVISNAWDGLCEDDPGGCPCNSRPRAASTVPS